MSACCRAAGQSRPPGPAATAATAKSRECRAGQAAVGVEVASQCAQGAQQRRRSKALRLPCRRVTLGGGDSGGDGADAPKTMFVPTQGEAVWVEADGGEFTYCRFELLQGLAAE